MQGTDSSLLNLGLNEAQQALNGSIVGLTPQMGRLSAQPNENKPNSAFASMLLQLQAGTNTNESALVAMAQAIVGNNLPEAEHPLPTINQNPTEDTTEDTIEADSTLPLIETDSAELNTKIPASEAEKGQYNPLLSHQALSPEQIKQAKAFAQKLQQASNTEDKSTNTQTALPLNADFKLDNTQNQIPNINQEQNPEASYLAQHGILAQQVKVMSKGVNATENTDKKSLKVTDLPVTLKPQAGTDSTKLMAENTSKNKTAITEELPNSNTESTADNEQQTSLHAKLTPASHPANTESPMAQTQQAGQQANTNNLQAAQINVAAALDSTENTEKKLPKSELKSHKEEPSMNAKLGKALIQDNSLYLGKQSQNWGKQLGSHITTLIKQDVQEAKIHLDPPELGSLEIKLQVQHQEARIQIHASHVQVRDVLEQQAFRLRENLAQEGMNLSGFDVSSGSKEQQQSAQEDNDASGSNFNQGENSALTDTGEHLTHNAHTAKAQSLNLLDTFA